MLISSVKTYKSVILEPNKAAQQYLKYLIQQIDNWETPIIYSNINQAQQQLNKHPAQVLFFNPEATKPQEKNQQNNPKSPFHWIKTLSQPPVVIITAPTIAYAQEAFTYAACDYLCHPITLEHLMRATLRAQRLCKVPQVATFFFVNVSKAMVKVVFDNVLYIESMRDYIHIHTSDGAITTKIEIGKINPYLPTSFLRVHRSFIINTKQSKRLFRQRCDY